MNWINPGVMPLPAPSGPVKRDGYTFISAFASAVSMALQAGEALVEEELKLTW